MNDTTLGGQMPTCPHCFIELDSWHRMKMHVKYCQMGAHPRVRSDELACYFCRAPFNDFAALAKHVRNDCINNPAPKIYTMEEIKMILDSNIAKQGPITSHTFLKARHINGKSCDAEIIAFRQADSTMPYSDYLLDVKIGKAKFTQGLRERGEDMIRLVKMFGLDTDKWIGKTVSCYKETYHSDSSGKDSLIVRVEPIKK